VIDTPVSDAPRALADFAARVLAYPHAARSGHATPARSDALRRPAAALELIHVYSLVHDDLRRGRPTCHRAYDEATAILVGDALQALGFAVLASGRMDGVSAVVG